MSRLERVERALAALVTAVFVAVFLFGVAATLYYTLVHGVGAW